MRKNRDRKLSLHVETLRSLSRGDLDHARGAMQATSLTTCTCRSNCNWCPPASWTCMDSNCCLFSVTTAGGCFAG